MSVAVRQMRPDDFDAVIGITLAIYPGSRPWSHAQLKSHIAVFPEGQLIAELDGAVVGMASSLIVLWDDYTMGTNWRDFTDHGMFTNHDPWRGRTLYGAEVMVHPSVQGKGVGKHLYAARRDIVMRRRLLRIRAGARLRDYHRVADRMTPEDYTRRIVKGELSDGTLSFQIKQGFHVIGVARNYLRHDPESLGNAAVIEWLNPEVATAEDYAARDKWALGE